MLNPILGCRAERVENSSKSRMIQARRFCAVVQDGGEGTQEFYNFESSSFAASVDVPAIHH